ncbi:TPA: cupin domain-containing protein [Proteus mirabilis]|uniref:cupin domain-containing protein n=1 Tax=Proteus mirabilis TaxID=584 RepID=UPI0018C5E620|nr:cupin domain-containing protein [Proteus mirabilis]HDT0721634.1 cupin domain-containing protein [Proteus mirabilis]HEJ9412921.1 cupin domain-containing protein [Proteus mirabilis]HEJ9438042.1 cupin domain-containing protein [Proteus mirabilis]HEK1719336.1 cupin domain-containing protein [Proteus mirabilis]
MSFFIDKDIEIEQVEPGITRKILSRSKEMMIVKVFFDKDIQGKKHHHPHQQMVYVLSGSFEYCIENESKILHQGDSVYISSDKYHYCKSLSQGVLLDIFTPSREDFLY